MHLITVFIITSALLYFIWTASLRNYEAWDKLSFRYINMRYAYVVWQVFGYHPSGEAVHTLPVVHYVWKFHLLAKQ